MARAFGFLRIPYQSGGFTHHVRFWLIPFGLAAPFTYVTPPVSGNADVNATVTQLQGLLRAIDTDFVGEADVFRDNGVGVAATYVGTTSAAPGAGTGSGLTTNYSEFSYKGHGRHVFRFTMEQTTTITVPSKIVDVEGLPEPYELLVKGVAADDELRLLDGTAKGRFIQNINAESKHWRKVLGKR